MCGRAPPGIDDGGYIALCVEAVAVRYRSGFGCCILGSDGPGELGEGVSPT
jgi:hypothetical protein